MTAYYFTQAKWAYKDLLDKRIKVSRFLDLNDPFELLAVHQGREGCRKQFAQLARKVHDEEGVICFSKSWRNPLMWSHYADRHRGVCLAFEATNLRQINYRPDRLWRGPDSLQGQDLTQLLLTTKFSQWQYEQEVRMLLPLSRMVEEKGLYFKPFEADLKLTKVIVGPRCCICWKEPLASVAGAFRGAELIKARLSFRQFRVCCQRSKGSLLAGYEATWAWQECSSACSCHRALLKGSESEIGRINRCRTTL